MAKQRKQVEQIESPANLGPSEGVTQRDLDEADGSEVTAVVNTNPHGITIKHN
jgi:hypothetical protein